jgi:hypothetical protein
MTVELPGRPSTQHVELNHMQISGIQDNLDT